ncbi:MAG: hypothetical protein A2293_09010 [Elusimicrobia bacterium RIFOXYB2_FULL_49_7]|nr:MAG: hypothetical protein A2293_09010 [Elusimicrobia bacterium RIFOXYB2_FULL_49_7]
MFTFLILFFGIIAFVLTGFSWYRNYELFAHRLKNQDLSRSDLYIDYPIRVLWLIYITIFSIGFIFNNLFPN